ncbi:VWA domain-containing protein [Kitasatospora purpeofusca]|uniref:VWA domain-containing protein n=1 Tax=Kitasatospora purpeofusca TaxID=67352 RepID=UPI00224ED51A|nr:VWA domain-containing protein [Kitasatospora purpeofusca]MCX4759186.1 VWA domain-containing protein [Kitasatospora purpeofusca]WSR30410.1 VWA domain-containing protein [Kitasatospora purpeofusca]
MTVPPPSGVPVPPADLAARLTAFVRALRTHGLRIGPAETVDAAAVLAVLGLAEREQVRAGLAAALLRTDGQRGVFDAAFDLFFPLGVGDPEAVRRASARQAADPSDPDPDADPDADPAVLREELRARLVAALAADDRAALAGLAGEAVAAFGRYGGAGAAGRPGNDGWSAYQTLGRLAPETLLARVLAALRAGATGAADAAPDPTAPDLADHVLPDEIRRRIQGFRAMVATEARRRAAELRGTERLAERAVAPSPDRIDFLTAGRDQLAELRRTVHPLARKLATRLAARRRRAARGRIDLRRTLRRSLSTGGVPLRPAHRLRRPARPELVLLCDVSGSVAGFSDFTLLLVQAMRDQFSKVRVFAFVNRTAEVTDLLTRGGGDPATLARRILTEAKVMGHHGNSDYGSALGEFAERHLDAVGPRTAVLILGDARNNYRDPHLPALRLIAARARQVHWLNPEQPSLWGTGDSAAPAYAEVVPMHCCRNARRLGEFIGRLLPV